MKEKERFTVLFVLGIGESDVDVLISAGAIPAVDPMSR
jgi:hypothetical protein